MQSQDFAHKKKKNRCHKYRRLNGSILADEATLFRENEIHLIFTNLVFAKAFFLHIN